MAEEHATSPKTPERTPHRLAREFLILLDRLEAGST